MDMLKIHAAALEGSITAYHEFLQYYDCSKKRVYGFVEGKDDPSFYRGLIESNLPDDWEVKLIISGRKDKVFEVFDKMDWSRFPKKGVCFFVDRDLSEFLGESYSGENIYVTDNYSIENEVVNFFIMQRYLEEILGVIGLNPTEINVIRLLFESNLKEFSEAMAPIMAQILLWRRSTVKVSLNNIEPKEFFIFKEGRIELNPSFLSAGNRLRHAGSRVAAMQATDDEIADAEVEFREKEGIRKYIRGKYLMWFFVQCAKEIHEALPSLCPRYSVVPQARLGLGARNAMIVIASWVRCPTSLKVFLEHNFVAFIKEVTIAA